MPQQFFVHLYILWVHLWCGCNPHALTVFCAPHKSLSWHERRILSRIEPANWLIEALLVKIKLDWLVPTATVYTLPMGFLINRILFWWVANNLFCTSFRSLTAGLRVGQCHMLIFITRLRMWNSLKRTFRDTLWLRALTKREDGWFFSCNSFLSMSNIFYSRYEVLFITSAIGLLFTLFSSYL